MLPTRLAARAGTVYLGPRSRGVAMARRLHRSKSEDCLPTASSSDPRTFSSTLQSHLDVSRADRDTRFFVKQATELIAAHVGDGDHREITNKLSDLAAEKAKATSLDWDQLYLMTRAARGAGLFKASHFLEQAALEAYGRRAARLGGVRGAYHQVRHSLEIGNLEEAVQRSDQLWSARLLARNDKIRSTLLLIELISGNPDVWLPTDDERAHFVREVVEDETVLIYGPGLTEDVLPNKFQQCPVSRVMGHGGSVGSETDLARNRTDIIYANGATSKRLSYLSDTELVNETASFRAVVLKSRSGKHVEKIQAAVPHAVRALPLRPEMVDGGYYMVPIMAWDLLARGATGVHIIGTSFYIGRQAYRSAPLTGSGINIYGATDQHFRFCSSLALHNVTRNRQFMRNLMETKRITGDSFFLRSLLLQDEEYLSELDSTFGSLRR